MDARFFDSPLESCRLGPDPPSRADDIEDLGDHRKERKGEEEREDVPTAILEIEVGLSRAINNSASVSQQERSQPAGLETDGADEADDGEAIANALDHERASAPDKKGRPSGRQPCWSRNSGLLRERCAAAYLRSRDPLADGEAQQEQMNERPEERR